MRQGIMEQMSDEQQYLVYHSMEAMDRNYDDGMKLVKSSPDRHSTRGSAHYALGLLVRNAPGDMKRACEVLGEVMDLQFNCPDEIYHGTFRTAPQEPHPPVGNLNWKSFAPGFNYFLDQTLEKISVQFIEIISVEAITALSSADIKAIKQGFQSAVDKVLPPVWKSYDPNWREFISCTFAIILEQFEGMLPDELVFRMDESMVKAVEGSIDRRLSDATPMNSNIELMHIFISHYFGHRFNKEGWMAHADKEALNFHAAFMEYRSFAEFNTTTYYGVDLTVLGLWRQCGKSDTIKHRGHDIETGLWENIALFYNPSLENLSGPFSRAYEMEMREHSSLGVFLFLALGKGYEYLAAINCESEHDPMIALVGVDIPQEIKASLIAHQGDRMVEKKFRELCERDKPGTNTNLCTATAWIERDFMIGAMSGSKNTNGQLHPATIHWKSTDGSKYYMRLIRRESGEDWNTHLRGITFEAKAQKDHLTIAVHFDTDLDIEVFFEIRGKNISSQGITPDVWTLPGLTCQVDAQAPVPSILEYDDCIEIVYRYHPETCSRQMNFTLHKI